MANNTSIWSLIMEFIKSIFSFLFTRGKKVPDKTEELQPTTSETPIEEVTVTEEVEAVPKEITWSKEQLLTPLTHRRYISIYCIADLQDGPIDIKTASGNIIYGISSYSRKRLDMEGTGRLPNGRVVNVDKYTSDGWVYTLMGSSSPDGVGINGKALVPWFSVAHNLKQLKAFNLFGRKIVIPGLRDYVTPTGASLSGVFEVHDTGGGLRECPYSRGLWRSGDTRSECGQFDLFIGGPETVYKQLLGTWDSYYYAIVMPRDTESVYGIQETLNLLIDAGLNIDGVMGPKTKAAIVELKKRAGLDVTVGGDIWTEDVKRYAELSLNNW